MSNALAISGVTAVLQFWLNAVYNSSTSALASVKVTAIAPDLIQASDAGGNGPPLQVNVFLHQVTPNAAWRNAAMPSLGADGATRLRNTPLALDLHYLLTAYASEDTQAEALLGYAILMLYENPILPRADIRTALNNVPQSNPLASSLTTTGLADQMEMIKITPTMLGREELAWIWTALKADYRPTFTFQVSVVLIEPQLPTSFAMPVLSRNIAAQAGPLANLTAGLPAKLLAVQPPAGQTASTPGDKVTVMGKALSGASQVALMNPRLGIRYPPFAPSAVTGTSVAFVVPDDPANLPAGLYNLWLILGVSGGMGVGATNILPLVIAPKIILPLVSAPASIAVAGSSTPGTLVTVTCHPAVLSNQNVSLSLAGTAVPAQPFSAPATTLTFQFVPALSPGTYVVQLRVDGVDSAIAVDSSTAPPTFTGPMLTV